MVELADADRQPPTPPFHLDVWSIRLVGAALGAALSALVCATFLRWGLAGFFYSPGTTLEGFPYDALIISLGTVVGLFLGFVAAPRVVDARRPIGWIVSLSLVAPPLVALVFQALTFVQQLAFDGDLGRWSSLFVIVLIYSYFVALPATVPVSVVGCLLLRRLVHAPRAVVVAVCAVLVVSAGIIGAGALATTVGTFGIGPGAPARVAPLTHPVPIARDRAIVVAAPYATELSLTPAELVSADAYEISDLCNDDLGFPSIECEYSGPEWAVVFAITAPDGHPSSVLVMIDAEAGELLYTSQ